MAAGAKETLDALRHGDAHEPWSMIALSSAVAALTAFVVVKWLLGYVRSHTFTVFGWYRILAGAALLFLAYRL
jgi:undecaprenyl-diphosphatase